MTMHRLSALVAACALAGAACAPLGAESSEARAAATAGGGSSDAAGATAASDESARAASEEAASEAAAIAAREAQVVALAERSHAIAAEHEAALVADVEAAVAAAKAEAERIAAEEEAARIAAEEEARRKAEEAAEQARELQTVLKDLGYYSGGIDGDIGSGTKAAIRQFQSVNGLAVDGIVGAQTEAALASGDAKPRPENLDPGQDPSVLSVSDAQRILTDLRYYIGPIDGQTSDSFRSALVAFQKVQGISADGGLGPQSSRALRDPRSPSLAGGNDNRIEIDLSAQVIHVVKGGSRIRTVPTSSGNGEQYETSSGGTANAKTPVGNFVIERRITGLREADLGSLYDPLYFYKGWAIHGSNNVPSYPASHGCTRVTRSDILWLADQMPNGTQVRVYGGTHTFIPTY